MFVIFDADVSVVAAVMCCVINVDFLAWVVKKAVAAKRTGEEYLERAVNLNLVMELVRGCSQMTSAFFGVSDTPWCLSAYVSLSSAFGLPLGASN